MDGPTLAAIAEHPACEPPTSRLSLGRGGAFKLDVRKLKALGLTLSLDVGYQFAARRRLLGGSRPSRSITTSPGGAR